MSVSSVPDHLAELGVVAQDPLELGDLRNQLFLLALEILTSESGQAAELHVEDVVGLDLTELEWVRFAALRGPQPGPRWRGSRQ